MRKLNNRIEALIKKLPTPPKPLKEFKLVVVYTDYNQDKEIKPVSIAES